MTESWKISTGSGEVPNTIYFWVEKYLDFRGYVT